MIYPVIMAGGSGTRFWPRSRLRKPKQLTRIIGPGTMIQQTAARLRPAFPADSLLILTNHAQVEEMARQLPDVPRDHIIGEPAGRDTAPCIGLAAILLMEKDPDAVMAILAADQILSPEDRFIACLQEAARLACAHAALATLGIVPSEPSDQYGYLHRGERLPDANGQLPAYRLKAFKEKPPRDEAELFVRSGEYYWNSGNFIWRAADILAAIKRFMPELHAGLMRIRSSIGKSSFHATLNREYPLLPKASIDYGVMEKADNVIVVEADVAWDDVGSWNAVTRHATPDGHGNVVLGRHSGVDTRDCIVAAEEGHLVATLGAHNLIIVQTPDATLVADRSRAAEIKQLVEHLRELGLEAYL